MPWDSANVGSYHESTEESKRLTTNGRTISLPSGRQSLSARYRNGQSIRRYCSSVRPDALIFVASSLPT